MNTFIEFLSEEATKAIDKNKENAANYEKAAKHHIKIEKSIESDITNGKHKGDDKGELKILSTHHGWARHHYTKAAEAYKKGNAILGDAHVASAKESVKSAVGMQADNNKLAKY